MSTQNPVIKRALLSVSDKTGLVDFAKALDASGVEILSTGGTAAAIRDAGIKVIDVSDHTGFPEMMDGRVKTLHPKVHGGLLALRDNDEHVATMKEHDIGAIDLLAVNLYPFEATVAAGADYNTAIENIDIGGPAMIRSAAKNHPSVTVITDTEDFAMVLEDMEANDGATTLETRKKLAARAYARTAAYDAAISNWFANELEDTAPRRRAFAGTLRESLRYGENPHQHASFYVTGDPRPGVASARQLQGKALSYNNINDTDAAFELVGEFDPADGPAVAIIKHANPSGVAKAATLADAYRSALACDSTSAFGGIIALNQKLDLETTEEIAKIFTEVIIAPGADEDAIARLAKKKNLRLLLTDGMPNPTAPGLVYKAVAGGFLVQSRDAGKVTLPDLKVVTKRAPTDKELEDLLFAFTVAKHVKSNTIVYAKDGATVGIGAGQMSRIDSAQIAGRKAREAAEIEGYDTVRTIGSAVASEAFIPFVDGLMSAVSAGATSLIQPGGSIRDEEVIAAADEAGIAMVFTGMRHFRH